MRLRDFRITSSNLMKPISSWRVGVAVVGLAGVTILPTLTWPSSVSARAQGQLSSPPDLNNLPPNVVKRLSEQVIVTGHGQVDSDVAAQVARTRLAAMPHVQRAYQRLKQGDGAGAVQAFEEARKADPSAVALDDYGDALEAAGRTWEAILVYRQIVYANDAPDNKRDWLDHDGQSLKQKLKASGNMSGQKRYLSTDVLMRYALLLAKAGQNAEALQAYQWGLDGNGLTTAQGPKEERVLFASALRHLSPQLLRNNLRLFEAAARTAYGRTNATWLRRDGTKPEEVEMVEYQKAISLQPGFAPAYYLMGNALNRLGKHNEARAAWQNALKLGKGGVKEAAERALRAF